MYNYHIILIYIIIAALITAVLTVISWLLNKKSKTDNIKLSTYETGCLPSSDGISNISIHFYIIGIIFLILDIEIILLFPWVIAIKQLGIVGFYKIIILFNVLTLGFIYEWSNNSLQWTKS